MNEFETKILDVLSDHFSHPEIYHRLEFIPEFAFGFEGWFQIETIIALIDSEVYASTLAKSAYDSDIVTHDGNKDVGIELRCWTPNLPGNTLINALTDHPNADLYLFLFRNYNDKLSELNNQLVNRESKYKQINSDWILMLVK